MEEGEQGVNDPVLFQKRLPGHGPQQKIHPHGKDENKHDKAALANVAVP